MPVNFYVTTPLIFNIRTDNGEVDRQLEMYGTGTGSCPIAGGDVRIAEPWVLLPQHEL
jgi:hypothetical protein